MDMKMDMVRIYTVLCGGIGIYRTAWSSEWNQALVDT